MKKRILTLSLTIIAMMALLTVTVGAATTVDSAEALTSAITNGAEIQLTAPISADVVIPAATTVTIDLNGQTLTNVSGHTITVEAGGVLTVTDSGSTGKVYNNVNSKAALYVDVDGKATLNGGTFDRNETDMSWYTVVNLGTMDINAGVTINNGGTTTSTIHNGRYIAADYNANDTTPVMTIDGATVTGGINAIKNDSNSIMTIKSGSFSGASQYIVLNYADLTITGGTFGLSTTNFGVHNTANTEIPGYSTGELTIDGGTYGTKFSNTSGATIEITGNVTLTSGYFYNVASAADITIAEGATLTINSGAAFYNYPATTLNINDGATLTIKEGASLINYGDITLGGTSVASIALSIDGNTMMASAVSYATVAELIIEGTYTNTGDITVTGEFTVEAGATVTNSGTIDLSSATDVTIDGAITNNDTIIFPAGTSAEASTFENITGTGTVQIDTTTYDNSGTDISTVSNETELLAAIAANVSYITLDDNITLTAPISIDYDVTIEGANYSIKDFTSNSHIITITEANVTFQNLTFDTIVADSSQFLIVTSTTDTMTALTYTLTLTNVDIINGSGHGISVTDGYTLNATDCDFDFLSADGAWIYGISASHDSLVNLKNVDITINTPTTGINRAINTLGEVTFDTVTITTSDTTGAGDLYAVQSMNNPYTDTDPAAIDIEGLTLLTTGGDFDFDVIDHTASTNYVFSETALINAANGIMTDVVVSADITLDDDLTATKNIVVAEGVTLTIDDGVTLSATITNNGTLDLSESALASITATITNNGTVVLPDDATSETIAALGITGTGTVEIDGTSYENDGTEIVVSSGSSFSGSSTYSSSVASASNGDVSVSSSKSSSGTTITITTDPDDGYVVGDVTVTYSSGKEVSVTDNGDGTYSYIQPGAAVTVTVTFVDPDAVEEEEVDASGFYDVDPDAYYYDAMLWALDEGITTGYSDDTFRATTSCTRAQVVTFLWRAAGEPAATIGNPFSDLDEDAYYYEAVLWAVENGITAGYADGTFGPSNTCTRGQIVTFMFRMDGEDATDNASPMTDMVDCAYYYDAALWAIDQGITTGYSDGTFQAVTLCNRGQIVTFLYRYLG